MIRPIHAILIGFVATLVGSFSFAETPQPKAVDEVAFPTLSGPYLGQEMPGPKPVLFAPGIVSTDTRAGKAISTAPKSAQQASAPQSTLALPSILTPAKAMLASLQMVRILSSLRAGVEDLAAATFTLRSDWPKAAGARRKT